LELPVWTQVDAVLRDAAAILNDLSYYTGASAEIREVFAAFIAYMFTLHIDHITSIIHDLQEIGNKEDLNW